MLVNRLRNAEQAQHNTAIDRFAQEALAIEQQDAKEAGAVGYMARLLVQVTMPHSKPRLNEFKRENGPLTIRMLSPSDVGLPYGHYPRLLLSWISTEAVRTQSPTLELGESLSDFMTELGLAPTGGRWGSVTRLRDHMKRLFSTAISWTYDHGGQWLNVGMQPVESAQLWWDPKQPDQATLWRSTLKLNQRFYDEVVTRPVPIDMRALKLIAKKRSPMAIDIYMWLTYRMSYLRKKTTIPWSLLQLQFGGDYASMRDFKKAFIAKLSLVHAIYPAANCQPERTGLILSPSRSHIASSSRLRMSGPGK